MAAASPTTRARTVTIKSEETRAYLTWLKDAWDKGIFPPGNTTWDGAGDNQAYLSGQAAFIANTGSVGIAAQERRSRALRGQRLLAAARRAQGHHLADRRRSRARSRSRARTRRPPRRCIEHLSNPEFMNAYFNVAIYGPVLKDQAKLPAFDGTNTDPGRPARARQERHAAGLPDVYNAAYADVSSQLHHPQDGAARRRRRLGLRRGDGRSPGRRPGDLRQVLSDVRRRACGRSPSAPTRVSPRRKRGPMASAPSGPRAGSPLSQG